MIQFICDWCSAVKLPEEVWVLGRAAEALGVTSARREVTILSGWTRELALHPLAVHFCTLECKDKYMAQLFNQQVETDEVIVKRSTTADTVVEQTVPAEVVVEQIGPAEQTVIKKVRSRRRRKRAA